jgi:hypothetical protein
MADPTIDMPQADLQFGPQTQGEPCFWPLAEAFGPEAEVTAGRFDHVDQPSIDAVVRESLGAALDSLGVFDAEARRLAAGFRGPDAQAANGDLVELVTTLRKLTVLTAALATAARSDLARLACGSDCASASASELLTDVANAVERLVTSQLDQDWAAAADSLQFELAPSFAGWKLVLDAIGRRYNA